MASVVETAIRKTVTLDITALADFNRKRLPRADHAFLSGIHTPMTEEKSITDLDVFGTIPVALEGRYVRIGPNPVAPTRTGY